MDALVTARLRLEPLVAGHADALYPILLDPRQDEFVGHGPPTSLEALRGGYRKLESRRSPDGHEQWLNWALVPHEAPALAAIGFVQATVLADARAWVAWQVGAAWWGRGFGTEATRAMLEHLAARYGVAQCMATIDARNLRSRRLVERLGFREAAGEVVPGDVLYLR